MVVANIVNLYMPTVFSQVTINCSEFHNKLYKSDGRAPTQNILIFITSVTCVKRNGLIASTIIGWVLFLFCSLLHT